MHKNNNNVSVGKNQHRNRGGKFIRSQTESSVPAKTTYIDLALNRLTTYAEDNEQNCLQNNLIVPNSPKQKTQYFNKTRHTRFNRTKDLKNFGRTESVMAPTPTPYKSSKPITAPETHKSDTPSHYLKTQPSKNKLIGANRFTSKNK